MLHDSDHPSHEEIVLLHSGELEPDRVSAVEAHVAQCGSCGARYKRLDDMYGLVSRSVSPHSPAKSRLLRKSIAVSVVACLLVYLFTGGSDSAHADALLSRASAEEMKAVGRRQVLRLRSSSGECHILTESGKPAVLSGGNDCAAISSVVKESGWKAGDLLSPQKFQTWRQSVTDREDVVERSGDETLITTRAEMGVVLLASMRIRTLDYRPVAAHYKFSGVDLRHPQVLDVSEVSDIPPTADQVESEPEPFVPSAPSKDLVDVLRPARRREAQVRLALHKTGLDGNVLLAIENRGSTLRVWGVVGDDAAKHLLLRQLAEIEAVAVDVVSENEQQQEERPAPWNPPHGDSAPLALRELDALFPNQPEARQQYTNRLDFLVREIAGATRDRQAIRQLRRSLADAPESKELAEVASTLDTRVQNHLQALRQHLLPLLPTLLPLSKQVLSASDGQELYELVQQVAILSTGSDALTLDEAFRRISTLLQKK